MSKRVLMAIWIGNVNDMGIESPFRTDSTLDITMRLRSHPYISVTLKQTFVTGIECELFSIS